MPNIAPSAAAKAGACDHQRGLHAAVEVAIGGLNVNGVAQDAIALRADLYLLGQLERHADNLVGCLEVIPVLPQVVGHIAIGAAEVERHPGST